MPSFFVIKRKLQHGKQVLLEFKTKRNEITALRSSPAASLGRGTYYRYI
jgi:hypothetical protein